MAGMFGADNNNTKAMMQDLEDVASMYSQAKPASDDGIMKAPQGEQIDAGSWWAWLSGATRQKAQENIARVQEELSKMGMNTEGTSPQYQQELLDGILQARQYRDKWGITESLSDEPKLLEEKGDFPIPEQSEITTEELPSMDEEASLADRLSNIQYVAYRGDTDPETGQEIKSTADLIAEDVASKRSGLMAKDTSPKPMLRPLDFKTPDQKDYENNYVKTWLKTHEGTKAHKSLEGGKDTAAYGVKFSKGLDRNDFSSDSHFAAAVALKHRDEVKSVVGADKFDGLPKSVQYALVDLNFNVGKIGGTADKADAKSMMENTLLYAGMTTKAGERATLMSLAKRRAWNWNKTASDIGAEKIKKISLTPLDKGARYTFTDAKGNVIKTYTTTRMPVKLDKKGKATKLTETQEYSF